MPEDLLAFAREVIRTEASALAALEHRLDDGFLRAAGLIHDAAGSLVCTGMGKAGYIAQKISASFASTGTPSHFLHPAEAVHGDLGRVRKTDVVLALSFGGETEEITRLLALLTRIGVPVIGITGNPDSTLARASTVLLPLGDIDEACPHGLAPSTSTTCMLALGDALFLAVSRMRGFQAEEFALYHPGGSLGRKLLKVEEAMSFRAGENLPTASDRLTVGEVLAAVSGIKRRSGAVILTAADGRIAGIFSDSDLRRLIETGNRDVLSLPVASVMTRNPKRISAGKPAGEAVRMFHDHRVDELPVVDAADRPLGLIDVQDAILLKLM